MEAPQYEPITTLGKLEDYSGVPFFGSFRGSGKGIIQRIISGASIRDTKGLDYSSYELQKGLP